MALPGDSAVRRDPGTGTGWPRGVVSLRAELGTWWGEAPVEPFPPPTCAEVPAGRHGGAAARRAWLPRLWLGRGSGLPF